MTFGQKMRELIAERGTSLRKLSRDIPYDKGQLSKVSNDLKPPSQRLAELLDQHLGANGELVALVPAKGGLDGGGTELELIELNRRAEATDLGSGTLDAIDTVVDRLCRDYPTAPAATLRTRSADALRYVLRLIEGRTTLAQHRELFVDAGWLAALLGCVEYDLDNRASAEIARRMALQLGEQAGHGEIVAWSWEIAAWSALLERRYADAVNLCDGGLSTGARISPAGAQLALQAGRAYALMGDSRCRDAMEDGRRILDQLPGPERPGHHFGFTMDKYLHHAATILTWWGKDDAAAEEYAREVLRSCEELGGGPSRRQAMTMFNLSMIAARRGDLDEAVSLGISASSLTRRPAALAPRARDLYVELAERYPDERQVAEYGEFIESEHRPPSSARTSPGAKDVIGESRKPIEDDTTPGHDHGP